jgi:phosphohistidine phosphatase
MIIYLVRHAWAGEYGDPNYPDDSLRPLTAKGQKRFRRVAKRLVKRGFAPAAIATSPLVRCRQTADALIERLGENTSLTELQELSPGAKLEPLLEWSRQYTDQNLAWVGHAPDVGQLTTALIGAGAGQINFEKGAAAAISFDDAPSAGSGTLLWLVTAEMLGV